MPRLGVAIALLAVAGVLVWYSVARDDAPPGPDGDFDVYVVGPSALLHDGTVTVDDADALRVVQALGAVRGFTVAVDDLAGCQYDYVRGIAGLDETSTGGWNYYVRGADSTDWAWQDHAASCAGLRAGDDVLWCWVEPDERCAVYP